MTIPCASQKRPITPNDMRILENCWRARTDAATPSAVNVRIRQKGSATKNKAALTITNCAINVLTMSNVASGSIRTCWGNKSKKLKMNINATAMRVATITVSQRQVRTCARPCLAVTICFGVIMVRRSNSHCPEVRSPEVEMKALDTLEKSNTKLASRLSPPSMKANSIPAVERIEGEFDKTSSNQRRRLSAKTTKPQERLALVIDWSLDPCCKCRTSTSNRGLLLRRE